MKKTAKLIVMLMMMSFVAVCAYAGDLDPTEGPTTGTMHTLTEIYDLAQDTNTKVGAGSCTGAPVAKTGQTTSYATGDDGDLEKGVAIPNPRFTINLNDADEFDGTVTDNLTGLIWLKNANVAGSKNWAAALTYCNALAAPAAGLTDGSVAGDWRLPNKLELASLTNSAFYNPCISNTAGTGKWTADAPFSNVQSGYYWSGTTYAGSTVLAWYVHMGSGTVGGNGKANTYYVWPVRGGND